MAYDLWVAAQRPRKRIKRLVRPAVKAEEADLA